MYKILLLRPSTSWRRQIMIMKNMVTFCSTSGWGIWKTTALWRICACTNCVPHIWSQNYTTNHTERGLTVICTDNEMSSVIFLRGCHNTSVSTILESLTSIQHSEKYQYLIPLLTPLGKLTLRACNLKLILKDKYNKAITWGRFLLLLRAEAESGTMTVVNINNRREWESANIQYWCLDKPFFLTALHSTCHISYLYSPMT